VRHTRPPWELILIDNGSTDGTGIYLAGVQDVAPVPVTAVSNAQGEGKRDITDIDCLHGEVASVTGTLTLDASGLGAKDVLFGDVPFSLPRSKGIATAASSSETARTATAGCRSISRRY